MNYGVNGEGYYGDFGGAYIPEMLYPNISELRERYLEIMESDSFKIEFGDLLRDYAGRPSPLFLARRISEQCGFKVYLKREDLNHTGSHKINNAIGQILIARRLGRKRIIAETGAGQHGVATATVCALFGLKCVVYMGELDTQRQAPNVQRMKYLGAEVIPVKSGSRTLKDATNEAFRDWIAHPDETHYLIGSTVGAHPFPDMVSRLQSVISKEIREQICEKTGSELPACVLACVGGGSNAMGAFYHFLNEEKVRLIGVEAAGKGLNSGLTAATIARGREGVLHGSRTLVLQDSDGQIEEAYSVSAGLDYPGVGPQHAFLSQSGRVTYVNATDDEAIAAAERLSTLEGIIPALESAHALAYLEKMRPDSEGPVVVCLSGRGDKDMETYLSYKNECNE